MPAADLLIVCDHADNRLPPEYGDLGLPAAEFTRHIAYDPGAAAVARGLAERLGAPAVLSTFSRLLIDANRGEDDPTLIMRLSDGAVVPGNAAVDGAERARRIARYHAPYHAAIDAAIGRAVAAGRPPALVSIHSFTPGLARRVAAMARRHPVGRRPAPCRCLSSRRCAPTPTLVVGDNEPYSGVLANDTMHRHGTRRGLAHALIEIRQDLIGEEAGVAAWAERLAAILKRLNDRPELHEIMQFGTRVG